MIKSKDTTFDYEGIFGWRHVRCQHIATSCFLETDNGTKHILRGLTDPDGSDKETYHETYSECDFFANRVSEKNYCYIELATNIYPLLLRLFPIINGSSPIGGRHDTQGTEFQKLSPQEQDEQAPIIARGAIAWFIAWQRETTDQVEDYESDMDYSELCFMRSYYMDIQERNIDWLHTGRRWRGIDLITPFEDEHLKTETEYYEQAKVSLPKYLGEHHPRLVEYALEFGEEYLRVVKEAIEIRRKYTAEQAIAHRQKDKFTEGKQAALYKTIEDVSSIAEAESNSKLENAVNMIYEGFGDKSKAREYLVSTRGKTETVGGRRYYLKEPHYSRQGYIALEVYRGFCFYNDIEYKDETELKRGYKSKFSHGIWSEYNKHLNR